MRAFQADACLSSLRKEEDSDLALVLALQHGEDRTLNELMDRHREGLFRFVLRHVRNETDALELTMETFVRAYFNVGKFRPRAKFVTWLYQIALNLCRDHLRSRAYQYWAVSSNGTKTYAKRSAALHQRRWSRGAAVTRPSGLLLERRSGSDPTY